ncbi:MAG: hypothetical protein ACSHX6_07630 [Akkermansiaceae bacterium]
MTSGLYAQEAKDPFAEDPYVKKKVSKNEQKGRASKPVTLSAVFELFSVTTEEAATLMRANHSDKEMYEILGKQAKLESVTVARGRSGERSASTSVKEMIYPTEYDPIMSLKKADVNKAKVAGDMSKNGDVLSYLVACAFETRHVGLSLEVEPILGSGHAFCDVRVDAELVSYTGEKEIGKGAGMLTMPMFETQSLKTGVTCELSKPYMLGTLSRPPLSEEGDDMSKRVWFAVMTMNLVK